MTTSTRDQLRLLLVDDHPAVREAVRHRLEAVPRFKVTGEASDVHQALALLSQLSPHVAVIDIGLGKGPNGLFLAREMSRHHAGTRALIWSMHANRLAEARAAGVRGYVLKSAPTEEIVKAIEVVAEGGSYYSAGVERESTSIPTLTPTELRILRLVASGKRTRDIAKLLKVSHRTVETHRQNILSKLGATSSVDMVIIAYRMGLVDLLE